jgi:hypothetical protein
MVRSARARLLRGAAAALFAGALGGACGNSAPKDKNFGTDVGADFRAPIVDAGGDTNVTPASDATGAGGAAGTATAADAGAAGTSGAAGAAGADANGGAGGMGGGVGGVGGG